MAKCTYGTGCFLLRHTGATPVASAHGLVTTVAWQLGGEIAYALEGSAFIAGAAIQWLCDGLGLFANPRELEQQAASVANSDGVVFVPALTGLGAPHWRPEARGMLHGLTRGTTRAHLARAALEGIALQNLDLLLAMDRDAGSPLRELRVDGGAAANDLLLQFQADLLGLTIQRPQQLEATAFGAACLAGLGVGLLADASSVATAWQPERRFEPRMAAADVQQHRSRWANAVGKA
jgi:glycerol kinase